MSGKSHISRATYTSGRASNPNSPLVYDMLAKHVACERLGVPPGTVFDELQLNHIHNTSRSSAGDAFIQWLRALPITVMRVFLPEHVDD